MAWYYKNGDQIFGPLLPQELKQAVSQGIITATTQVRKGEDGSWFAASNVQGLIPPVPPPPLKPIKNSKTCEFAGQTFQINTEKQYTKVTDKNMESPKQLFCTNCGNLISEQAYACMSCGAKPIGHKKFCRHCGVALNPEQVICIKCGVELTGNSVTDDTGSTNFKSAIQTTGISLPPPQRKDRFTFWTMLCTVSYMVVVLATIICLLLTVNVPQIAKEVHKKSTTTVAPIHIGPFGGVPVGGGTFGHSYEEVEEIVKERIGIITLILTILPSIAYMCCYYIWLFRLWEEVPQKFARTSAGNAALFALIPFYNLYWQFIVFCGWYDDVNKTTKSYGLGPRFDGKWIKLVCIYWVTLGIVGSLTAIVGSLTALIPPNAVTGISGFSIFLCIVGAVITLPTYWTVRKNVLTFIDIKASQEK